jgi:WD40 repeat protein
MTTIQSKNTLIRKNFLGRNNTTDWVFYVKFMDDAVVAAVSRDMVVTFWAVATGAKVKDIKPANIQQYETWTKTNLAVDQQNIVTFNKDGTRFAAMHEIKYEKISDVETSHRAPVDIFDTTNNFKFIKGCLTTTKREGRGASLKNNLITCAAFSPKDDYLALGNHKTGSYKEPMLFLYYLKEDKFVQPILSLGNEQKIISIDGVAFSPNGNYLVATSLYFIYLFDIKTQKLVSRFDEAHYGSDKPVFSPDSSIIAVPSSFDKKDKWVYAEILLIKNYTEKEPTLIALPELMNVNCVAFSNDSLYVLSGSADGNLRIWSTGNDSATRGALMVLAGHTKPVLAIAVSPDGKTIASGSEDATLKLWDFPDAAALAAALAAATANASTTPVVGGRKQTRRRRRSRRVRRSSRKTLTPSHFSSAW